LAAKRDKASKFRDYYVWSKKRPKDANKGMVFPGVQKRPGRMIPTSASTTSTASTSSSPIMNTSNPEVQAEVRKIMGFWLQLGVDGFRMDALPFVIQKKGPQLRDVEQYPMLRDIREFLQWRRGDSIILAEANVVPKTKHALLRRRRRPHAHDVQLPCESGAVLRAGQRRLWPLIRALEATRERPATAQWGLFLRNHDELDLGRLTKPQRQRVFDAFGPDKNMQLYDRGIRRRLAPMLNGDQRRLELAYSLLFSLPGTPVIRYGDEIGWATISRCRSATVRALRCSGRASRTPVLLAPKSRRCRSSPPAPTPTIASTRPKQRRDPQSLLNWTERMIRMRKEVPEFGWGDFKPIDTQNPGVLALRTAGATTDVLTVHNLRDEAVEVDLRLGGEAGSGW